MGGGRDGRMLVLFLRCLESKPFLHRCDTDTSPLGRGQRVVR